MPKCLDADDLIKQMADYIKKDWKNMKLIIPIKHNDFALPIKVTQIDEWDDVDDIHLSMIEAINDY